MQNCPGERRRHSLRFVGDCQVTPLALQCCSCLMCGWCLETVTLLLSSSHSEEILPGTCTLPDLGIQVLEGISMGNILQSMRCSFPGSCPIGSWVWWDHGSTGASIQTGMNLQSKWLFSGWALFHLLPGTANVAPVLFHEESTTPGSHSVNGPAAVTDLCCVLSCYSTSHKPFATWIVGDKIQI